MAVQGVDSSLYVYQEVLEGCNELVTAEEYSGLGQVPKASILQLSDTAGVCACLALYKQEGRTECALWTCDASGPSPI